MKPTQGKEIENARKQLEQYELEYKKVEGKVNELEAKNASNNQEFIQFSKLVSDKEKEVEQYSNKIKQIKREHGSSDSKFVKKLELKSCKNFKFYNPSNDSMNLTTTGGASADQNKKQDLKFGQADDKDKSDEFTYDFIIRAQNESQTNDFPIDLSTIRKIGALREYLAKNYGLQKDQIFLFDEGWNILLDDMELENSLFPGVFRTLKKYFPIITVEAKKTKNTKVITGNQKEPVETLITLHEDMAHPDSLKQNSKKKVKSREFWRILPKVFMSIKYLLENLAIVVLIGIFTAKYINNDIVNKFNLNSTSQLAFEKSLAQIYDSDQSVNENTLFNKVADTIQYMMSIQKNQTGVLFTAIMPSIIVQRRYSISKDCNVPSTHKSVYEFDGSKKNCLDLSNESQVGYGTDGDKGIEPSSFTYTTEDGGISGFIFHINSNIAGQGNKIEDQMKLLKNKWVDYQTKSIVIYFNQFNSPSQMATQNVITIENIQSDGSLQSIGFSSNSFSVEQETTLDKTMGNIAAGIASTLLLFALIEYVGFYGQNTSNITVQLYKQRKKKYDQMKEKEKSDKEEIEKNFGANQQPNSQRRKKSKNVEKLQDHQYFIIDFTWLYILLKRPVFFDVINIISLILILVQSGIVNFIRNKREGIIKIQDSYLHLSGYIAEEHTINSFTAVNILLLMLSFTKYLASWSFTLKIYSQIMTTFIWKAWSMAIVVMAVVLSVSFSWIVFINGAIKNHDNFAYNILIQIKGTFFSSYIQDLRESIVNLPSMPPLIKSVVFSPFTIIVMMIIQLVVHFGVFSFMSALMAHNIHVTKEEMRKIQKEIEDFEKRKVVNSTTFFRKSIQNFNNQEDQS